MPEYREISHRSAEYTEAIALRLRVLRAPLGLSFSRDELEKEADDWHLAAFDGGLVACLVLSPLPDARARMRQVAVLESRRGLGIGRSLVLHAEDFARARDLRGILLHAREPVVPFYEALGYVVEGEPFIEITLPHRVMTKRLE